MLSNLMNHCKNLVTSLLMIGSGYFENFSLLQFIPVLRAFLNITKTYTSEQYLYNLLEQEKLIYKKNLFCKLISNRNF